MAVLYLRKDNVLCCQHQQPDREIRAIRSREQGAAAFHEIIIVQKRLVLRSAHIVGLRIHEALDFRRTRRCACGQHLMTVVRNQNHVLDHDRDVFLRDVNLGFHREYHAGCQWTSRVAGIRYLETDKVPECTHAADHACVAGKINGLARASCPRPGLLPWSRRPHHPIGRTILLVVDGEKCHFLQ